MGKLLNQLLKNPPSWATQLHPMVKGMREANKLMWKEALLHNHEMVYVDDDGKLIQGKARDIYPSPKKPKRKKKK